MKLLWRFMSSILLVVLAPNAGNALAQSYPSKPVRIVVPFAAGGSVDALARLIGPKMAEAMGQPVIVENRPGAGAIIGADVVAKAAADGHTMLLTPNSLAITPAVYRKLPFDATRDFSAVTQLIATELVLVANPNLPAASVKELIALAKSKPGSLNYGSTGVANPLHLTMELLKSTVGIDIVPIPYKGDGPLNTALIAGEVELAVLPLSSSQSHIRSGRLRALGVTGSRRSAAFPDVPTVAEAGVPGFDSGSWQGLFVPANTPRDIIQRIQVEAVKALRMPDVRDRLPALGQEPVGSTPDEFEAKFKADIAKFVRIVKEARIPLQD